jgi:hypothetical protein
MQTVPQSTIKAKYATVYDEPATIAKVNGVLYVLYGDGSVVDFEVEMAPFTTILGDCALVATQALLDARRGGAAAIACSRMQEVA